MSELIDRAREYLKDKYLDLADVPEFIRLYVAYYDELAHAYALFDPNTRLVDIKHRLVAEIVSVLAENKSLRERVKELEDWLDKIKGMYT